MLNLIETICSETREAIKYYNLAKFEKDDEKAMALDFEYRLHFENAKDLLWQVKFLRLKEKNKMAINFKEIAARETVLSDIMTTRKKIDKASGEYHISDFDIIANNYGEPYAICAISEKEYFNGGFVLTKIFTAFAAEYDGNIELARKDFRESGGLDVRLERTKTKNNRDITKVEVI